MPAKKRLQKAVKKDQLAHAYLFVGSSESKKEEISWWFIEKVLTQGAQDLPKALKFDTQRIAPETDQKRPEIKIDEIRQVRKFFGTSPIYGAWKGVIIAQAESMNKQAANAFLKILEEPRGKRIIILTASNPRFLPATVVSRCELVKLESEGQERGDEKKEKFDRLLQANLNQCFAVAEDWSKLEPKEIISLLSQWMLYLREKKLISNPNQPDTAHFLKALQETINLLKTTNVNRRLALEKLMIEYGRCE